MHRHHSFLHAFPTAGRVRRSGPASDVRHSLRRRRIVSAFCLLPFAFAAACAKAPAATAPQPPAPVARAADPVGALRQDILDIVSRPGVQRGVWGVIVHSLDRNDRLFELNPNTLLVPASTAKMLTAATAAEAVGWDYRYETTLHIAGTITDQTLHGDLIVTGSGDPAIGGRAGDDLAAFVEAVKTAGITTIDGRIIGNDDAIEEPRPGSIWSWDDVGYGYGATFGALNFAENRMFATVSPGDAEGKPAVIAVEPFASGRPIVNRTTTVAADAIQALWPEQRPGETALTIAGTIRVGAPPARLSISAGNPTAWFASVLRNHLIAAGIMVTGDAVDADDLIKRPVHGQPIYTHYSRTLAELAEPMLKDSINLYAEAVMRLNAAPTSAKTNDDALAGFTMRMTAWGIPTGTYQLVDGSGLSRRDVVSPAAHLTLLQRMYDPTGQSPWMRLLPVAGIDGSLASRMKDTPAENNARGKTGSMSNIRALAGYVTTAGGEHLAFVTMVNNFEGTGADANQAIDAIVVKLAESRR